MNDRVLVPLDGSARAEQILVQVARLLRREDAEVILARALEEPVAESDRRAVQEHLEATADVLRKQGVRARWILLDGPAAEAILKAAADEAATLVAISTHGRSGLARWLLGSVTEKILRGSPAPVLLMRSFPSGPQGVPLPSGSGGLPFRRILVPVDGSDMALHVVPTAASFAKLFGSEVDVLRVAEPPLPPLGIRIPPVPRSALVPGPGAEADAEKAVRRFESYGVRARPLTAFGDPGELILETAEAKRCDLIAMASHGRSGMSRWALGSVTERILRHATLPMLVVRGRT